MSYVLRARLGTSGSSISASFNLISLAINRDQPPAVAPRFAVRSPRVSIASRRTRRLSVQNVSTIERRMWAVADRFITISSNANGVLRDAAIFCPALCIECSISILDQNCLVRSTFRLVHVHLRSALASSVLLRALVEQFFRSTETVPLFVS